jgi:hypothetical protein
MIQTPLGRLRHSAESVAMQSNSAQIQNAMMTRATIPSASNKITAVPPTSPCLVASQDTRLHHAA